MTRAVLIVVGALAVITAVFGPFFIRLFGLPDPSSSTGVLFEAPSSAHLLGTDRLGRDVAARMLSGNAILVIIPLISALCASFVGLVLGAICAVAVPWLRVGIRIFLDALLVIPPIIIMLAIAATTGLSPMWLIVASIILALPLSSRFFEVIIRRITHAGFVDTARCAGDGWLRILFSDVLPVLARPFCTDMLLRFIATVYLTATASFLGAGASSGKDTWATLIHSGLSGVVLNPWGVIAPACAILALTIPPSLVGLTRSGGNL